MNVEEDTEDIKQIARFISSISNSFNQVAHRVNKGGKLYDEDIADMKERLEEVWRLLSYPYDPHGNIRRNCLYLQPGQNRRPQICC